MAVKAKLSTLDGVDDGLKAHYAEGEDGAFYFAVEGVEEMPALHGLKSKNKELLDKYLRLQRDFEALGVSTPEEVAELRKKVVPPRQESGEDVEKLRAEYDTRLKQTSEQAQKEIQAAKELAKAESDAARRYFQTGEITRAIGGAKGVPELLTHVVERHVKVERSDDGVFSLRVIGADGQPRIKDSQGSAYSLDDLVADLRSDPKYGRAFDADGKSGSGASPLNGGGSGGGPVLIPKNATPQEYRRLKADAESRNVPYAVAEG